MSKGKEIRLSVYLVPEEDKIIFVDRQYREDTTPMYLKIQRVVISKLWPLPHMPSQRSYHVNTR